MLLLLISLIVFLLLGVRIAFAIAASCLLYVLFYSDMNPLIVIQQVAVGADSLVLLAIPFFLLSGELMNSGGITNRLVKFSLSVTGSSRGGLNYVVVIVNMILACVSGAAIASAAAVGSILIPTMKKKGYDEGFAAALNATAATIGPVIPPSVGFIIYASLSNTSVSKLFVAGTIPGLLIGFSLLALCAVLAFVNQFPRGETTFSMFLASFKDSLWALLMPVIILGGILSGIVTPTEAGLLASLYGFVVGMFVYKELAWKQIPDILLTVAKQTASIMFIVAAASVLGLLISRDTDPKMIQDILAGFSGNREVILVLVILIILAMGTVMEGGSIMVILTPILLPILKIYNIDLIHFGVVFQLAIMMGLLTPPVGLLVFVISASSGVPVKSILKNLWPFYLMLLLILFAVAYIPELSLGLNKLLNP